MKRIWNILAAMLAVLAIVACMAPAAFADIKGTDYVGSTTVADRNLTVTQVPTINAKYGILCDEEGNVLWSRGEDTQSAMASITKIMTAVVVLENANLDDVYTVSPNAASVGESSIGVQAGDQVTVENLLYGRRPRSTTATARRPSVPRTPCSTSGIPASASRPATPATLATACPLARNKTA